MVVKFNFNYKNKRINLDVLECNQTISKMTGLMFKKNSPPLLFSFQKPTKLSIHSFFCKPFIAIWFLGNQIVDIKAIKTNQLSIKPKEKFDKLLEIPKNCKEYRIFTDEGRNI